MPRRTLPLIGLAAPLVITLVIWVAPWLVFLFASEEKTAHLTRVWICAGVAVVTNFLYLVAVFLHPRSPLPSWAIAAGFLFTFLALVGAYASADIAASHQVLTASHPCYVSATGQGTTLSPSDAVYFTLSTVTTVGFGDIAPKSATCRWLTSSELALAFPILGLSVGGVAGRMLGKVTFSRSTRR